MAGLLMARKCSLPMVRLLILLWLLYAPLRSELQRNVLPDSKKRNLGSVKPKAAFDLALDYVKQRVQVGKSIAENQSIQHRFADMALKLEAAR